MTRHIRLFVSGLIVLLVAVPLALRPVAQTGHAPAASHARDLAAASLESVGISSERVRRIETSTLA